MIRLRVYLNGRFHEAVPFTVIEWPSTNAEVPGSSSSRRHGSAVMKCRIYHLDFYESPNEQSRIRSLFVKHSVVEAEIWLGPRHRTRAKILVVQREFVNSAEKYLCLDVGLERKGSSNSSCPATLTDAVERHRRCSSLCLQTRQGHHGCLESCLSIKLRPPNAGSTGSPSYNRGLKSYDP